MKILHFDCNATTAASEPVIAAMLPWLGRPGANPSATHPSGRAAGRAVREARAQVAAMIGAAEPTSVVFTSSGSESTAMAFGSARAAALESNSGEPRPMAISTAEHSATRKCAARAAAGTEVITVPVNRDGELDREAALAAIARRPALLSLILLNNETGVISDLEGLGAAARNHGVLFHVDAVQAPGKTPIDVAALDCDYLSLSAHKFHGPRGIGALYVRPGAPITPLFLGGPQEEERRAGTENVPGIVGMGVAAEAARERALSTPSQAEIAARRDRLEAAILEGCPGSFVHGGGARRRASNTSSIGFDLAGTGLDATALLGMLHDGGLEVSAGSACNSSKMAPSPVLRAMGCDDQTASSALRFSIAAAGMPDAATDEEVSDCIARVLEAHGALAALKG
ncbi:Cysteine desulfurase [Planctomycetes bacterium Poly30]|uniref:cysteine desulfurase n=1 Tax=Saltatorellus ferox TaxID=2528018 RepID=A0A518EQQ9_9BACT|nr:Cysteine desulfurase [Planctomycetes bacterium Poly30]